MDGFDGWRRWWTGVFDTEGTDVESPSVSPVVRVTRTVVACSSSEQFAGYQWLLSGALHSASKRKREGQRVRKGVWFGKHLWHLILCIKPCCFAFDQMSSWYSAAGYGWSGSCGSWYGRRRGSWGGKSEVRFDVEWFCQKCGTGGVVWIADTVRVSRTDDADTPQTSAQEKIGVLEKTLAGMGDDEPFGWQESFGERTRKTPEEAQWPEENGKAHRGQTKLDQQRIQTLRVRECKAGGVAREPQSAKGNSESCPRGDQDSPGGPAERRGN